MNHQPYENWILDGRPQDRQEKEQFELHLKECPECFRLQQSWERVHSQIKAAPFKSAPDGFVPRWKIEFAQRIRLQERKQARTMLISLGSGAGAILIALAAVLLPKFSFISIFVGFVSTLIRLFDNLQKLWGLAVGLIQNAPTTLLIVSGILIAGWISLILFAWGISIWRVSLKEVTTK
jgi:hypothetical protein